MEFYIFYISMLMLRKFQNLKKNMKFGLENNSFKMALIGILKGLLKS